MAKAVTGDWESGGAQSPASAGGRVGWWVHWRVVTLAGRRVGYGAGWLVARRASGRGWFGVSRCKMVGERLQTDGSVLGRDRPLVPKYATTLSPAPPSEEGAFQPRCHLPCVRRRGSGGQKIGPDWGWVGRVGGWIEDPPPKNNGAELTSGTLPTAREWNRPHPKSPIEPLVQPQI